MFIYNTQYSIQSDYKEFNILYSLHVYIIFYAVTLYYIIILYYLNCDIESRKYENMLCCFMDIDRTVYLFTTTTIKEEKKVVKIKFLHYFFFNWRSYSFIHSFLICQTLCLSKSLLRHVILI